MTNKQTIDGVSRETIQHALNAVEYLALRADDIGTSNMPLAEELRSLLDSPARSDYLDSCDAAAFALAIGTLHRDRDERIIFESSSEIHIKDGMQVYAEPTEKSRGNPMSFERVRDGIADFLADNMPIKKYTLAEIEKMIREVAPTPTSRTESDQ